MRLLEHLDAVDQRLGVAGPPNHPPGWLSRWLGHPWRSAAIWTVIWLVPGAALLLEGRSITQLALFPGVAALFALPAGYLAGARTRDAVLKWDTEHKDGALIVGGD